MAKNILIVEDEKTLQLALRHKMEKEADWKIFQAFNGEEGLNILKKEKIDLILLDVIMPVMDGIKMIEKIRKNRSWQNIKIIILTNSASYQKTFDFNDVQYLIKSNYSLEEVATKIKEVLGD